MLTSPHTTEEEREHESACEKKGNAIRIQGVLAGLGALHLFLAYFFWRGFRTSTDHIQDIEDAKVALLIAGIAFLTFRGYTLKLKQEKSQEL